MTNLLLILLPALFAGGIVSTVSGGGLGILLTLIFGLFYDIRTAIVLSSLLGLVIQVSKIITFHRSIHWRIVLWYSLGAVPAAFLAGFVLFLLPIRVVEGFVAVLCLVFVVRDLLFARATFSPTRTTLVSTGVINGVISGIIGQGALIRLPALLAFGLSKEQLVGTAAVVAFLPNISKSVAYFQSFVWTPDMTAIVLAAAPVIVISTWVGRRILKHIPVDLFEKIILCFVALSAGRLLLSAFGLW